MAYLSMSKKCSIHFLGVGFAHIRMAPAFVGIQSEKTQVILCVKFPFSDNDGKFVRCVARDVILGKCFIRRVTV